jgi:hypothetical protein
MIHSIRLYVSDNVRHIVKKSASTIAICSLFAVLSLTLVTANFNTGYSTFSPSSSEPTCVQVASVICL